MPPPGQRDVFAAELLHRPAEAVHAFAQPVPGVDGAVDAGGAEEDEAVREPGGPLERGVAGPAEPDRDGPRRFRHERGPLDVVALIKR